MVLHQLWTTIRTLTLASFVGSLGGAILALLAAMLLAGCSGQGNPFAADQRPHGEQVDVLDYIIGQPWPRVGTQLQNQVVDQARQEVCWVKYGRPEMYECWRWTNAWVYHAVDHALDGGTGRSYVLKPGTWLPRHLLQGERWAWDVRDGIIQDYTPSCVPEQPRVFPYRLEAAIEGDQLVLTYEPYDPHSGVSHPETFAFQRGRGWVSWSRPPYLVTFDQPGGPNVAPDFRNRCS